MMLLKMLSDLVQINDVLFIIKNDGATSEIRSDSLSIRQKDKWITIGDNAGPAHMHINSESIKSAKFVEEEKPERTSFSVMFFDKDKKRILAAFFTKMYDPSKSIIPERKKIFDILKKRYSTKIHF